jgi:peptide deformylase
VAVRPIVKHPDPRLRQKTRKVGKIDAAIQRLIDDMIDTMHAAPGVGLAAPQIGVSLRLAVIEAEEGDVRVLINPEILEATGERLMNEGCLSIPGYYAEVKRHERVVLRALDRNGKRYKVTAENSLLAHAIEHEMDHLNGVLYIDYLKSLDELKPVEEAKEPVEV